MPEASLCLTTVAKRKDAERLASQLVKRGFAACANIIPGVISHYRWKGKICRDAEFLILLKTTKKMVKRLERELQKLHPYELPEFVVLPLKLGSARYLAWIAESVG